MTEKITSAEAHEELKRLGDRVLQQETFDRTNIQEALDALDGGIGAVVPSGKSYLDWARREHIVEPVEGARGQYRWAKGVEDQAVEIGRQMAQEAVTDMDPEHPMHEEEPSSDFPDIRSVVHLYHPAKRISRKTKRAVKRVFLDVGVDKVQMHFNTSVQEAYEHTR